MNAAIRAVTRSALDQGMTVYGVRQGWQGLVEGQFRQLSARDVGGIIQVGGTLLEPLLDPQNFVRRVAGPRRFATSPNGEWMVSW